MDLFEQVLHALEGTERSPQVWQTADGERTLERRTTGYDRWIEGANDGRLEAINALAVILEGVRESFDLDVEREIVEGWAIELRTAAESGEITARNAHGRRVGRNHGPQPCNPATASSGARGVGLAYLN